MTLLKPAIGDGPNSTYGMMGSSPAMRKVYEQISKVAPIDITVLITGETGTGKQLVADAIVEKSPRKNPYIIVNCTAIPKDLLEAELFGYKKGAFTGAVADRKGKFKAANLGMLLLDEIGDMDLSLQSKILRAVEYGKISPLGHEYEESVNVRVITTTNRDLKLRVREGKFREDLFYRLNIFSIEVPSLRERPEDIQLLIDHFVKFYSKEFGRYIKISPDSIKKLTNHEWKGNVRELESLIKRVIISEGVPQSNISELPTLNEDYFEELLDTSLNIKLIDNIPLKMLKETLKEIRRDLVVKALRESGGNKSKAARMIGMSRKIIPYYIEKYNIRPEEF